MDSSHPKPKIIEEFCGVEVAISHSSIDYASSMKYMQQRVDDIKNGTAKELIWLLEHEKVYTAGVSAQMTDLLDPTIPVIKTNRGGKITYHGPGQVICYLMLDLKKRSKNKVPDARKYVSDLENIIIHTLEDFGIKSTVKEGRIGVWVETPREEKIAAIGVRFSSGIAYHGFAVNIAPNLTDFKAIVPCGISEYGVCSLQSLGVNVDISTFNTSIIKNIKSMIQNQ